ncbi:TatD family hydrolase [Bacillus sp. JJ1122]|uniref:TatD family hydrolase n=1 Tax=Bacillus sp. JJ1122 TaxID=3122951 RepID=UPI002FFF307E
MKIFDSHIHFDQYEESDKDLIIKSLETNNVEGLITVSMNLPSCKENLRVALNNSKVHPAFGYHPEQPLPSEAELDKLLKWINDNQEYMVAVGEVGLPYYLRSREKSGNFPYKGYVEVLERFILLAKKINKPIILHAVYEDASVVCDLLEKHSIVKAHFHWFKGDRKTIERMAENKYVVSFTPDILYEEETREVVKAYPLHLTMAETDGPWPFVGIFHQKMTQPTMIHDVMKEISAIKQIAIEEVYSTIFNKVKQFYQI